MKKLFLVTVLIVSGFFSLSAQDQETQETFDITVNITDLESNKGKVLIALYKGEETFLKKRFKGGMAKIVDNKISYTFKGVPKGEYAVSYFHDENDNNKLDTKIFGIPKEPYGFSNNASGFMGPPKYEDAKFSLEANKSISIKAD